MTFVPIYAVNPPVIAMGNSKIKCLFVLVILFAGMLPALVHIPVVSASPSGSGNWGYASWGFRQQIAVTTASSWTNAQYQLTLVNGLGTSSGSTVYLNGKAQSDFADIRFADSYGNPLQYFLVQYNSTTAVAWVQIPSTNSISTYIYIYYGDVAAVSASNSSIFPLYDDFPGSSLNQSLWTSGLEDTLAPAPSLAVDNSLMLSAAPNGYGDSAWIRSVATFQTNFEIVENVTLTSSNYFETGAANGSVCDLGGDVTDWFETAAHSGDFISSAPDYIGLIYGMPDASNYYTVANGTYQLPSGTPNLLTINWNAGGLITYSSDLAVQANGTDTNWDNSPKQILITQGGGNGLGGNATVNYVFVATSPQPTYTFGLVEGGCYLTVQPDQNGETTPSGVALFSPDSQVNVTATPNPGYSFGFWTINGSSTNSSNPYSFEIQSNTTLVPSYIQFNYTLTVNAPTNGAINGSSGYYGGGVVLNLTATPDQGYSFVNWVLDGVNYTANPISIDMISNHTVSAYFALDQYLLTVNNQKGGSVNATTGTYPYGATITLLAAPSTGYNFSYWLINGVNYTVNPFTITISGSNNATAYFIPNGQGSGSSIIAGTSSIVNMAVLLLGVILLVAAVVSAIAQKNRGGKRSTMALVVGAIAVFVVLLVLLFIGL